MAVTMREAWTDERLDDFRAHVDQRFDAVDQRFDVVDRHFDEIDHRFDRVEGDIRELRGEVHRVHDRIDSLQKTMIICFTGMTASIVGAILVVQL